MSQTEKIIKAEADEAFDRFATALAKEQHRNVKAQFSQEDKKTWSEIIKNRQTTERK